MARGSFGATGGREPVRNAYTVMFIGRVTVVWSAQERSGVWWRGGVGRVGRSRHAPDRKCAPASCARKGETCAHGEVRSSLKNSTTRWRRQAPSLSRQLARCDGRRQAPEPAEVSPAAWTVAW